MDSRAAKLALARQKLKNHQERKQISSNTDGIILEEQQPQDNCLQVEATVDNLKHDNSTQESNTAVPVQTMHGICQNLGELDVNVTEILISSKRNLELQVTELQSKLSHLENNYTLAINNNNCSKQQISSLEYELKALEDKYTKAFQEILTKDKIITDLKNEKSIFFDENNNLQEQLEFTKSMLGTKEMENSSLIEQLKNLQNHLDAMQLQLQQVTSGTPVEHVDHSKPDDPDSNLNILIKKNSALEQQLKTIQKERDQINCHYQQYVGELTEQLKLAVTKNNELLTQVNDLSIRENSLIEQISDMEIRIQNMKKQQQPLESYQVATQDKQATHDAEINSLQQKYNSLQDQLLVTRHSYSELEIKCAEYEAKIQSLSERTDCEHDSISILKLTADIASDKLAAQRATEQNRKLKLDLQNLEDAFVKISKDKLELTEKVAAEKFLNRELTIKLAEAEETVKDLKIKLRAKDEEMMRLLNSLRELEERKSESNVELEDVSSAIELRENAINNSYDSLEHENNTSPHLCQHYHGVEENNQCLIIKYNDETKIPKEDAMVKLQDRFLKIMDEVANLSDEKHRLEHIILQLQNETDTICEYVALYQQQRSLLKKRDEERSAQIKIFQAECELLKNQLEELSEIIIRLAQDSELAIHFQSEPRSSDLAKVMILLTNIKSNTLIDPEKKSSELKNFYPCSCCSGQLIEV